MDRALIRKHAERFADRTLRIRPYHVHKVGLKKNGTFLKVNDYYVYGVPFEISLSTCTLLSILKKEEIEFFSTLVDPQSSIHYELDSPLFGRTISLFMRTRILGFEVLNKGRNYCLVTLEYRPAADDYREILVELFLELERLDRLYENEEIAARMVHGVDLPKVDTSAAVSVRFAERDARDAIVARVSLRKCDLFLSSEGPTVKTGIVVTIEVVVHGVTSFVDGTVTAVTPSLEVPGYVMVAVELGVNAPLADALRPLVENAGPSAT